MKEEDEEKKKHGQKKITRQTLYISLSHTHIEIGGGPKKGMRVKRIQIT